MKLPTITFFLAVAGVSLVAAQQNDAPAPAPDNLFDEIMQALPQDMQERLKNDEKDAQPHTSTDVSEDMQKATEEVKKDLSTGNSLNNLPEDVRKRVEQAISTMDSRRENRTVEFKQMRERKNAPAPKK